MLSNRGGYRQQQTPLRKVRRGDQGQRQEPHPRRVGRLHLSGGGVGPRFQTSQLQALRARRRQGQGGQQQQEQSAVDIESLAVEDLPHGDAATADQRQIALTVVGGGGGGGGAHEQRISLTHDDHGGVDGGSGREQ